jgi:xanthine/uracil permease
MADLGETSRPDTAHKHKVTSWITVILLTVATVVLGFAFVLRSIPLAVLGGVMVVVGAILAFVYRLMDDAH